MNKMILLLSLCLYTLSFITLSARNVEDLSKPEFYIPRKLFPSRIQRRRPHL